MSPSCRKNSCLVLIWFFQLYTVSKKNYITCTTNYLHLVIYGTAGSGKSFWITCLVFAIKHFNNDKVVLALRPTGNSANLISGRTVYDFFKIRMSRKYIKDKSLPYGIVGKVTQRNCLYLQALIVDERSLVGTTSLGWMEYHCRFGVGNLQQSWGGGQKCLFYNRT